MQLNDYKINRKLLKFTNNINFIGKNKYLSRESSANKMEQSLYKSLSSSQLLSKSHRDNNHAKSKIQEISTIGSIYSKDSAYFNSLSNEQLNIPPIRSLNKDDGDKLIANLNKQIKQQNLQISKLKQQIITQSSDLDNMSKLNEQFLEKQQSYEEITQSYHSSNQKSIKTYQIQYYNWRKLERYSLALIIIQRSQHKYIQMIINSKLQHNGEIKNQSSIFLENGQQLQRLQNKLTSQLKNQKKISCINIIIIGNDFQY
ncbi:unnamed protein product (macronuclear) [Paramecium tetraurelia]|uniref:Uncharacterized protein n=1 Tax=Paramecium tetraurelia TaxID=5888 RepID=A0E137_PARTE|nr:uncharacterized protein GSPATT00022173001 [Paramecium tetraurelia]CAK89004.1 unnamed protein product [Paramecium tetraurelia]|eukprot:XP_001456401.1 hypothetical protein (macronuclear) [Paramecium tetraurelia strain d4-2]